MFTFSEKRNVPILMYHSISQHATPQFAEFTVSPEMFSRQMEYLQQRAYHTLTVTRFIELIGRGETLPERLVLLTFDDGFADFFTDALPILQRYGLVATLYIATGFVNSTSRWLVSERETERPMLTWDQLAEISAYGIECGAHSHNHLQLDTLPSSQAQEEIAISKALLERHLGQNIFSFAYPFGYYTKTTQKLVRLAGYTSACAVKHVTSSEATDSFALTRLMITRNTNLDMFATFLTGEHLSIKTITHITYARLRTPIWQIVRRSSTSLARYLQGGSTSQ